MSFTDYGLKNLAVLAILMSLPVGLVFVLLQRYILNSLLIRKAA